MSVANYGIVLPYFGARETVELAKTAEEYGWDGVFLGDAIWTQDPLILLAAAAMITRRIRLGTMVLAMPLRDPRQLASESLALDMLSEGRLILGLATGATWMGWHAFPDYATDVLTRTEMLSESIDILTHMHQSQPFDYEGRHYHIRLSQLDTMHYPPASVQKPHVPVWIPAVWPRKQNVRRALKCDGVFPQKIDAAGKFTTLMPDDVAEMKAYIDQQREMDTPFDICVEGNTTGLDAAQARETVRPWSEAGATWWVESTWGMDPAALSERLRQGPPR